MTRTSACKGHLRTVLALGITIASALLMSGCSASSAIPSRFLSATTSLSAKKLEIELPLHLQHDPGSYLAVKIPKDFYTNDQQLVAFRRNDSVKVLELVPLGESLDRWSEILTLNVIENRFLAASNLGDLILQGVRSAPQCAKVAQMRGDPAAIVALGIEMYVGSIEYYTFSGTRELLLFYCFSGPTNCYCLQLTRKIAPEADASALFSSMRDFLTQVVELRTVHQHTKESIPLRGYEQIEPWVAPSKELLSQMERDQP